MAPKAHRITGGIAASVSQPVTRPDGARLQRRDEVVGKSRLVEQPLDADARRRAPEQSAPRAYQRRLDLVAVALAQEGAQIADAVNQAVLDALARRPVFAGEQLRLGR